MEIVLNVSFGMSVVVTLPGFDKEKREPVFARNRILRYPTYSLFPEEKNRFCIIKIYQQAPEFPLMCTFVHQDFSGQPQTRQW